MEAASCPSATLDSRPSTKSVFPWTSPATSTTGELYLRNGHSATVADRLSFHSGGVGNVCKFPNGLGKCSNKVCTYTSCTTLNYVLASDNSGCSLADITSDVNNCGGVGKVCPAYANADGAAFCRNKVCQTNCKSGYAFDFSYNYCRATASDINNCGAIGTSCLDKLVVRHLCLHCYNASLLTLVSFRRAPRLPPVSAVPATHPSASRATLKSAVFAKLSTSLPMVRFSGSFAHRNGSG